jgi:hypothetical protein
MLVITENFIKSKNEYLSRHVGCFYTINSILLPSIKHIMFVFMLLKPENFNMNKLTKLVLSELHFKIDFITG